MPDPTFDIDIRGLVRRFGRHTVLDGLDLQVPRGQTFAFLGRNGAGKTTTIRTLVGLHRPTAGQVRVLGLDPARDGVAVRRRIGYLAEDQRMYGWMRVEQMLRFMAPFFPTWDGDLARRYLKSFELPARTKVRHLSKGQSVRLGLLLALAHRPGLVILDDPVLGLDPIARRQFNRDLVAHLQGRGCTVFYSSHLLDEVELVADAVAILDRGRIVRSAPAEQLRGDIRQVRCSRRDFERVADEVTVLDRAEIGEDVAATVDRAEQAEQLLMRRGVPHEMVDLTLDEIFEALVIGRPEGRPGLASVSAVHPEAEVA